MGASPGAIAERVDRLERLAAIVRDPGKDARDRIRELMEDGRLLPPYGFVPGEKEARVDLILSPWYRSQLTADPAGVLWKLSSPVLALTGSLDRVNLADQNLPAIQQALVEGEAPDHTVAQLPMLNHFLQPAERGGIREVARLEWTFAPLALRTITDWIRARFGPGAARPTASKPF